MNDSPTVRVGVVGAGAMGERHVRTYAAMPGAQLVGVYDPATRRCEDIASQYGATASASLEELLREVDAITIASPTTTHATVAKQALAAGVHVLVEKPFAASLGEARELIEHIADARNLVVLVGHIERFNPVVIELKRAISGHAIRSATFRRMQPFTGRCGDTSVVHDLMIHDIDLALDLFGDDINEVDAAGSAPLSDKLDHAIAQLFMANGVSVTMIASRIATTRVRSIEVRTEEAWITADLLGRTVSISQLGNTGPLRRGTTFAEQRVGEPTIIHLTQSDALRLELEHFLQCVRGQEQPIVDAVGGLRAMIYADAIEDLTARVSRAGYTNLVMAVPEVAGRVAL